MVCNALQTLPGLPVCRSRLPWCGFPFAFCVEGPLAGRCIFAYRCGDQLGHPDAVVLFDRRVGAMITALGEPYVPQHQSCYRSRCDPVPFLLLYVGRQKSR